MKPKPQPYMREVVLDVPPVMQLDLYADTVIVTRRGANGRWTSYPILPQALAEVLGNIPASSGILPANTLAYSSCSGVARYVVYRPAGRAVIRAAFAGVERRLDIPTPPLVWEGQRTDYRLWALDTRLYPVQPENTPLYNAPFPNLYPGGAFRWCLPRVPVHFWPACQGGWAPTARYDWRRRPWSMNPTAPCRWYRRLSRANEPISIPCWNAMAPHGGAWVGGPRPPFSR